MYKRNQVEEAAYQLAKREGDTKRGVAIRLKRLLDTDRALGANSRSSIKPCFAFYSFKPKGRGSDVYFDEFQAFLLVIGLRLLKHGFPQQKVVLALRALRGPLQSRYFRQVLMHHLKTSRLPQSRNQAHLEVKKTYLTFSSAAEEGRSQKGRRVAALCKNTSEMLDFIEAQTPSNVVTIIEIDRLAMEYLAILDRTIARRRGR